MSSTGPVSGPAKVSGPANGAPPMRPAPPVRAARPARDLHPLAWWAWALGLAVAASRTTDPVLLGLILAVIGLVVAARRGNAPWARAFPYYLGLAAVVVGIRVGLRVVFGGGAEAGEHVLFTLPRLPLPSWLAGVRVGGAVTAESVLAASVGGLQLACLLCCVGAANALADPRRVLRLLPAALYEIGVAVVIALSTAPQLIESVQRVRRARRLRGGPSHGWGALRAVAVPVLEDALDRSLHLAAAMDARGYGRTGRPAGDPASRRTGALLLGGLGALCIGAYGLLDAGAPPALAVGGFAAGVVLAAAGLGLGGRRIRRTRYRPDRWSRQEWAVVACGAVPALVLAVGVGIPAGDLTLSTAPPAWPALPPVALVAVLVGALAALCSPPPAPAADAGASVPLAPTGAGEAVAA